MTPLRAAIVMCLVSAGTLWGILLPRPRCVIDIGQDEVIELSADGTTLITHGSRKHAARGILEFGRIRTWSTETGELLRDVPPHEAPRVRLFRGEYWTGDKIPEYLASTDKDHWVSEASVDGRWVVLTREDYDVYVLEEFGWGSLTAELAIVDLLAGKRVLQLPRGSAAAFSPDRSQIAVAVDLCTELTELRSGPSRWRISLYDTPTGAQPSVAELSPEAGGADTPPRVFAEGEGLVCRMAFSPDQSKLAVCVWRRPLGTTELSHEIWDVASGTREVVLPPLRGSGLWDLEFRAGRRVLIATSGSRQFAWDLTRVPAEAPLSSSDLPPHQCISPDGKLAALQVNGEKQLEIRALARDLPDVIARYDTTEYPFELANDGRLLAVGRGDAKNVAGPSVYRDWFSRWFFRISPDPTFPGGTVNVLDAFTGKRLGIATQPEGTHYRGISANCRTMITTWAHTSSPVQVWDLPERTPWGRILGWAILPAVVTAGIARWWKTRKGEDDA